MFQRNTLSPLIKHHAVKMYGRVEAQLHVFLTSTLDGDEWSASRLCRFTPTERTSGALWLGGWASLRAGFETVKIKIPGLYRELNPGPAVEPTV
jgi:hypothetical protein